MASLVAGVVALLVLLALAYANVSLFLLPDIGGHCWPNTPSVRMRQYPYGWPFACIGTDPYTSKWGTIWLEEPPQIVSFPKLAVNAAVALGVAASTFYVAARRFRANPPRMSIKTLLAMTGVCATYLGLSRGHAFFGERLVVSICFVSILAGLVATFVVLFDSAGWILGHIGHRNHGD